MTWSLARPALHAAGSLGTHTSAWALDDLRATDAAFAFADFGAPAPDPAELAAAAAEQAEREAEAARLAELARRQAELEAMIEDAYQRGLEEGRLAGEIAERARLRHAVTAAEQALDDVRSGEQRWAGMIEENVCALSAAIARQVIGRELLQDPSSVLALVRSALAEFPIDQPIAIRVCASDLAAIGSAQEAGTAPTTLEGHDARWLVDARIAPGGCLVEGRDRIVDGRVDTALERVYRRLTYTQA